jgi:hypothetical protein
MRPNLTCFFSESPDCPAAPEDALIVSEPATCSPQKPKKNCCHPERDPRKIVVILSERSESKDLRLLLAYRQT